MSKERLLKITLPYIFVFCGFFIAGLIFFPTNKTTNSKIPDSKKEIESVKITESKEVKGVRESSAIVAAGNTEEKPLITVYQVTQAPTSEPASMNSPEPTDTPVPTSLPQVLTLQINVSINGSGFSLNVEDGANQCDVLNKALSEGKISSLNMRFDNSLGTNGVYQINGVGKDNTPWWVYKVNGQSPSQGCSYIKVKNNDNVEWKYIGS